MITYSLLGDYDELTLFQDPYPKGEIFIGHSSDGYSIHKGQPTGWKLRDMGFIFHIKTPNRSFIFSAERSDDREDWMTAIQNVMARPMTPQDAFCRSLLSAKPIKKKRNSFLFS